MFSLGELSKVVGGKLIGDPDRVVTGVAPVGRAGPGDVTFATGRKDLERALGSEAGAVIVGEDQDLPALGRPVIIVKNPRLGLAKALEAFHPRVRPAPGIHPSAVVACTAAVSASASIGALVVVDELARIDDEATICAGAYVGREVRVGTNTWVGQNVVILERCEVGANCIIHPGVVIGADGFGFASDGDRQHKIPQVGRVVVEDEVELGANVCVDRATLGETVIRRGTKIDNLVQVAHNVVVGRNVVIAGQSGIAGSAVVGDGVIMAGQSGISDHVTVGEGSTVGARAAVMSNLPPGSFVLGQPARPQNEQLRIEAARRKLPELVSRIGRLEKEVNLLLGRLGIQRSS